MGQVRKILNTQKYFFEIHTSCIAMLHLGYAYNWGLNENANKAEEWFEKSAKSGNATGMAKYSIFLKNQHNRKLSKVWGRKALGK